MTVQIDQRAFRLARIRAGYTKPRLAQRAGLHPQTVRAAENGSARPTETTLLAIADALGVDPTTLLLDS